jgi:hypothetical protein
MEAKSKKMCNIIWKCISGYDGMYLISNTGVVKSVCRNGTLGGELKSRLSKEGYVRYTLSINNVCKSFLAHRLVAIAFIENPENKPQVNHKDGNKANNHESNLEWTTRVENAFHARNIINTYRLGSDNPHARLTEDTVRSIKIEYQGNPKIIKSRLAKKYNIDKGNLHRILNGKSWVHIKTDATTIKNDTVTK